MLRSRFASVCFALFVPGIVMGGQIVLNVSTDTVLPWTAVRSSDFMVGFDNLRLTTSSDAYTGPDYTVAPAGRYYNSFGWTNVYTLLSLNANPVKGAYLAFTSADGATVTYSYSFDASKTWNTLTNTFSLMSPGTWTDVANTMFFPPLQSQLTATLPQTVVISRDGGPFPSGFGTFGIENPEPASGVLLGIGLTVFWLWRRRQAKA
jgi:hypothetical protein